MTQEFAYMESQIRHGVSLEELLYDLGLRSGVEDIMNFSDVLIQSKKMGGNMRIVLQNCITSIEERLEVKKAVLTGMKLIALQESRFWLANTERMIFSRIVL